MTNASIFIVVTCIAINYICLQISKHYIFTLFLPCISKAALRASQQGAVWLCVLGENTISDTITTDRG